MDTAPRRRLALGGAIGALFAIGLSELLASLVESVPSLVTSIGDAVIDLAPPAVKDWAIETLGTSDKPALIAGIVVLAALFGAGLGAAGGRSIAVPLVGFLAFGVLGAVAAGRDPRADGLASTLIALASAASGVGAFVAVRRRAPEREPDVDRRAFLRLAGAFALLAGASALAGRYLVGRRRVATSRSEIALPPARTPLATPPDSAELSLDGLSPAVTPNQDFYRIDTALSVPRVDLVDWKLAITGLVDRPLELTYDDLLGMPLVEAYVTLACVSNEVGGDLVGNAKWLGVPLGEVLGTAGVSPSAGQIVGRSVDGFTVGFPTEVAFDGRHALIAVGMNGEPLPIDHGFPARLVVAGLYGYVSATKWLAEIELTTWDGFDAYWIPRGWAKEAPIKTQSRIDVPRHNGRVPAGTRPIAGVAWAPGRGVSMVEVQVDDGAWRRARLSEPLSADAWRQWAFDWEAGPGRHLIRVRATDGTGRTQPDTRRGPRPDGATGWHTVVVTVE